MFQSPQAVTVDDTDIDISKTAHFDDHTLPNPWGLIHRNDSHSSKRAKICPGSEWYIRRTRRAEFWIVEPTRLEHKISIKPKIKYSARDILITLLEDHANASVISRIRQEESPVLHVNFPQQESVYEDNYLIRALVQQLAYYVDPSRKMLHAKSYHRWENYFEDLLSKLSNDKDVFIIINNMARYPNQLEAKNTFSFLRRLCKNNQLEVSNLRTNIACTNLSIFCQQYKSRGILYDLKSTEVLRKDEDNALLGLVCRTLKNSSIFINEVEKGKNLRLKLEEETKGPVLRVMFSGAGTDIVKMWDEQTK